VIHTILIDSFKAFIGLIGVAALYCGCFLYPDEENNLQNRIEQFWISIDERRRLGQTLALASRVAGLISRILDRILGQQLFSEMMAVITCCFSLSVLRIWEFAILITNTRQARVHGDFSFWWDMTSMFGVFAVLLLLAGILAVKHASQWATIAAFLIVLYELWSDQVPFLQGTTTMLLLASLISDLIFLVAVRWTLRNLKRPSVNGLLVGALFQALIFTTLVALPLIVGHVTNETRIISHPGSDTVDVSISYGVSNGFVLFALNTVTGIVSLSFLSMLLFMIVHKLFWPMISRLLHPLARFELLRNRKVMIGVAVICFGAISPTVGALLEKLMKLF
jgi:hypothetical protein